jgi:hypothetical protein
MGSETGNGNQMIVKIPHMSATILIGIPQRPSLKGYTGGLFSNFLSKMKKIGMMYEMYSESVARDIMARNAVEEAILMRKRRQARIETKASAFVGIFSVG